MSTFIVFLPEDSASAAPEFSYVLSADGQKPSSQGHAAANLLPAQARTGVVLVLPARAVSWSRLNLPARVATGILGFKADPARVRAVVSGALEDALLDEPQRLHFATFVAEGSLPDADTRALWVATCNREWLMNGLQALDAAAIPVSAVVCECEPQDAGRTVQVSWTGTPDAVHVLVAHAAGVCALPYGAGALALAGALADSAQPVTHFAEAGALARAEAFAGNQVVVQAAAERWLSAATSSRNLAQLELNGARNARWAKNAASWWQTFYRAPQWRPVRWGLGCLVALQLLGLNALAWQEKTQLAEQKASLRGLLLRSFPQVSVVIDPALQMQKEVDLLAQSRGSSAGVALSKVLPVLVQQSQASWTAIDLEGGQLRIQGTGLRENDMALLNGSLAAQGLNAALQGDALVVRAKGDR